MKTKKDYTVKFMNYGEITIPAGTAVTHETAAGYDKNYHFVNSFSWIMERYPNIAFILKHDAVYSGIDVPKEFIEY